MRKRKQITLFLSLILLLTGLPEVSHAAGFKDIQGHWAQKNILWAEKEGYMKGYPDGTFRPNAPITRAEYYRLTNQFIKKNTNKISEEAPMAMGSLGYSDVKPTDWFYKEVQLGVQAGYIDPGKEKEVLNPTESILREEATWIFAKNQDLEEKPQAAQTMVDYREISENYKGLVGAAIEKKIIHGNEKKEFMPKKTLTRAEVVTIIAQFLYPDGVPGPDPKPSPGPQGAWYWSFSNSTPNFTKGYQVNGDLLNQYGKYFSTSDVGIIRQQMRKGWGGSCYGMAATAGLYKEGRLQVNNLNTPSKGKIQEIEPQGNYKAQSIINIFQLSQHASSVRNKKNDYGSSWNYPWIKKNTNDLGAYGSSLKQMINQAKAENTTLQLAYFWQQDGRTLGHANTIYDYREEPGKLILKVYDPNYPGLDNKEVVMDLKQGSMRAVSASNAASGARTINISRSYALPTKKVMEGVGQVPAEESQVRVLVYGDKTVVLKSGSERWVLSPDKGEAGIDSKTYTYYVPKRDAYIIEGQGALNLTIAGKDYSIGFDTDGFTKGMITPRSINLEGQKGNYVLNVSKDQANKNFKWQGMEVSGKNGRRVALTKEDFGFTLRGDQITGSKIIGLDKFQENAQTFNGKDRMVQIRQDQNRIKLVPNKYGNYDTLPDLEDDLVGSWIGRDTYSKNKIPYETESTLFITKLGSDRYRIIKRVEVPALRESYVLEYSPVRFNQATRELELRRTNCRVISGNKNIKGANIGPVLRAGQLNTQYNNGRTAHYTRF